MARHSYSYDKPRESTAGPACPDSVPFEIENISAEAAGPFQRPRHQLRHPGGKFAREGFGGYDAVTGCHMPDVRDHSVLHSPARPQPMAADWSQAPTYAEITHARQCAGEGRCAFPGLHQASRTD